MAVSVKQGALFGAPGARALAVWLGLAAGLALGGCVTEPEPMRHILRGDVAAVRLDPGAARDALTRYRASKGLSPVRLDPVLSALAQRQANAMATAGEMSHDVDGAFAARVERAGIDAERSGENIAAGYFSQQEVFDVWRKSPGHNANLLMPQATRFGIALAKAPDTALQVYWAMVVASDPPRREGPIAVPASKPPSGEDPTATRLSIGPVLGR